jgi:hypothetical protein
LIPHWSSPSLPLPTPQLRRGLGYLLLAWMAKRQIKMLLVRPRRLSLWYATTTWSGKIFEHNRSRSYCFLYTPHTCRCGPPMNDSYQHGTLLELF